MSIVFTAEELETLLSHRILFFADRVIFDAQPPLSSEDLAAVEAKCSGKIPPALSTLWSKTAGGSIAYNLKIDLNDREEAISWTELFYTGSKHYKDLNAWIDHELELSKDAAEENGTKWSGKLDYLPFGGFEYCDRIYAVVTPGANYGKIVAWKQGLPPAWTDCLHEDISVGFANDLYEAFTELYVEEDPRDKNARYAMGKELMEYLNECVEAGLSRELADKVVAYFCQAMIDWKSALENGDISRKMAVAKAALRHAIFRSDCALIRQLASAGVPLNKAIEGNALATDLALKSSKFEAVDVLVEVGAKVRSDILRHVSAEIPAATTKKLLDKGAIPDAEQIVNSVACGSFESARLMIAASSQEDLKKSFEESKADWLETYERGLKRVRAKELAHYLGEAGLVARIANLNNFECL